MIPRNESDENLMVQLQEGDRRPMELLVRRYSNPLLTFITRMTGDRHQGEDLFQEVFLTVWTKRAQFNPTRPFRPWLYTIAMNKCRAAYRRRSAPHRAIAVEPHTMDQKADSGPSPVDTVIATETETLVQAAVLQLPEQQRSVFVMRTFNGLSYGEIGQTLNKNPATARSLMHYALASLRRELQPHLQ